MMQNSRAGDLVQRAAGGDRAAWEELVERFSGLLWSIAIGYRLSQADAADVIQTTWLKLLEHLGTLRDPDRVGAWLATTARRECQRAVIQIGRMLPTDDERKLDVGTTDMTPEAAVLTSERDRMLWEAFAKLSPHCQRLLRLLAVAAPSYEEVASTLDMPVGSIGPTRARCLERLRRNLVAGGISADVADS
jgi:RNA polymerase sigma factor (sigma-70 family)